MGENMKCDKCNKPAICNYQDVIVRYVIDENGEYSEPEHDTEFEAGMTINNHLCATHEGEFLKEGV